MYKMIGAFCIFTSCGYLGLRIGKVYRERTDLLRFLQNGLNLLETEINYSATPLPLALKRVSTKVDRDCSILFATAADFLAQKKGATASEAWNEGIKELCKAVPLKREEISVLALFGQGLGNSAKEEQVKNISLAREQLQLAEKLAEEARSKNQRLWQYMGFCLGAVIVLLFI